VVLIVIMFNSAVLVRLLAERQNRQAAVLRAHARSTLSPELELRTQNGRWYSLPRNTDPERRAEQFNANHVRVAPSQLVPGLLGVYARRQAYPPGHDRAAAGPPNLGYYGGWLFTASEYDVYQDTYGHSMGIELSGLQGRVSGASDEGEKVMLVGDPLNAAVQVLHNPDRKNCLLTSRVQLGRGGIALPHNAIVLQAAKHVNLGDELTFCYSNQDWSRSPKSCMVCCCAVTKLDGKERDAELELVDAYNCAGFINGSPCPFSVHSACASAKGVPVDKAPYCPFCFSLSEEDTLPSSVVTVLRDSYIIRSDAGFATVLQRAALLGWTVKWALALPQPAAAAPNQLVGVRPIIQYTCHPLPQHPLPQPSLPVTITGAGGTNGTAAAAVEDLAQDSADEDSALQSGSQAPQTDSQTDSDLALESNLSGIASSTSVASSSSHLSDDFYNRPITFTDDDTQPVDADPQAEDSDVASSLLRGIPAAESEAAAAISTIIKSAASSGVAPVCRMASITATTSTVLDPHMTAPAPREAELQDDDAVMLTERRGSLLDPAGWARHSSAFPTLVAASQAVQGHGNWLHAHGAGQAQHTAGAVGGNGEGGVLQLTMRQWVQHGVGADDDHASFLRGLLASTNERPVDPQTNPLRALRFVPPQIATVAAAAAVGIDVLTGWLTATLTDIAAVLGNSSLSTIENLGAMLRESRALVMMLPEVDEQLRLVWRQLWIEEGARQRRHCEYALSNLLDHCRAKDTHVIDLTDDPAGPDIAHGIDAPMVVVELEQCMQRLLQAWEELADDASSARAAACWAMFWLTTGWQG
jgi:hypothetical protein